MTKNDGAPTMIRTWDPQIRNLVLYPTELPGQFMECDSSRNKFVDFQAILNPKHPDHDGLRSPSGDLRGCAPSSQAMTSKTLPRFVEHGTSRLGIWCSIRLSYRGNLWNAILAETNWPIFKLFSI